MKALLIISELHLYFEILVAHGVLLLAPRVEMIPRVPRVT